MRAGFEGPLPGRAPQSLVAVQNRRRADRIDGMQVNEHAERLSALPERMERRVVEILSVGMAIDHRTGEFELAYAAFEFVGGGVRAANGERGIALRLHAGTRQPNHRAANAGLIHRGEPQVAEIGQPRQRLIPAFGRQVDDGWIPVLNEIGTEEMLLKGNLFDHAFSSGRPVEHASFRSLYLIMDIRYKRQFSGGTNKISGGAPWRRQFAGSHSKKTKTTRWD